MGILAACCAILALGRTALASDVQLGDHVMAISDGIGCSDWTSFEAILSLDNSDLRALKGKLPSGCLVIHGAPPTLWIVDAMNDSTEAVCIRHDNFAPPCFWFSLRKVRAMLSAGQRRV
jgi:hypothetical protein